MIPMKSTQTSLENRLLLFESGRDYPESYINVNDLNSLPNQIPITCVITVLRDLNLGFTRLQGIRRYP